MYERVVKGLPAIAGTEIQVQGQTISLFGRHWEREFFYVGFQRCMLSWRKKSQYSCCMCAVISKCQTRKTVKKCTKIYCQKYDVGLCTGQSFEVYHTKVKYWE